MLRILECADISALWDDTTPPYRSPREERQRIAALQKRAASIIEPSAVGFGFYENLPDEVFLVNSRSVPLLRPHANFSNLQCNSDLAGGA
jgi:hypothetical protein